MPRQALKTSRNDAPIYAKGTAVGTSDVDLLVKFSPAVGFRDYDFMEQYFSKLLGRNVDIVSSSVLPSAPRFANRVCKEAVAI